MTILITGAAGYIGSQIVHNLSRLHEPPKVVGLDDLSTGYTCNLPDNFEFVHGNAGDYGLVTNLIDKHGIRQIIHCAASVVVPESVEKPMAYYANNVEVSYNLIRAAVDKKVTGFVFSSTAAVYGQPDLCNRPLREDDAGRPCSPYGWSKLMTEQMLRDAYVAHGMTTVILRYFNVAGADPLMRTGQTSPNATHLVTRAVRAAIGIGKLTVYGDGEDVRDYVHVADVADANVAALEWARRHNGCLTLNVGTGQAVRVRDVIQTVAALRRQVLTWETAQRREGDPVSIVANINLIRDRLAWSPRYSLVDMVEHAIQWERNL